MRRIDAKASPLAQSLNEVSKVGRECTVEPQVLAGTRVLEAEDRGVQGLAPQAGERRLLLRAETVRLRLEAGAVERVPEERMAQMGHVYADLVGAAGFELTAQKACDGLRAWR